MKSVLLNDTHSLYDPKERDILNKPFFFEGKNGQAVLLIHGWSSTPYEVRKLGKYLNKKGFTVSGPQLRGHGTVPKDLEEVKWIDWLDDSEEEYDRLKEKYAKVFVIGTSIGANLAVMLASEREEVSGLALLATPYKVKMEKLALIFARSLSFFRPYNTKFYPPTFGVAENPTRLISYQSYPIKSAIEAFELIKKSRERFSEITQPALLIQSASDHIIGSSSLEKVFQELGSKIKEKIYIRHAYHSFVSDPKGEKLFKDISDFLEKQ